jgi:hypothetical protein
MRNRIISLNLNNKLITHHLILNEIIPQTKHPIVLHAQKA